MYFHLMQRQAIYALHLLTPYTDEDREVMKAFIDSKRAICHKAIADGTKAEDIIWEATNG